MTVKYELEKHPRYGTVLQTSLKLIFWGVSRNLRTDIIPKHFKSIFFTHHGNLSVLRSLYGEKRKHNIVQPNLNKIRAIIVAVIIT